MKSCYQLIKTMAKFDKESRHRLYVFIKKTSVNSTKCKTIVCTHDAFCPLTQAWHVNCPFNCPITLSNGPFYSCVLSCQAFDLEWGWRWPCWDRDQYPISMITKWFAFEKQQGLYHNRVTLCLIPVQRLGNQAYNCKMDYCKHDTYAVLLVLKLGLWEPIAFKNFVIVLITLVMVLSKAYIKMNSYKCNSVWLIMYFLLLHDCQQNIFKELFPS